MATKKTKKRVSERDKDRAAIRDLDHWRFYGNTATVPGGRFKRPIDFIMAVQRVTRIANELMKRQDMLAKGKRK